MNRIQVENVRPDLGSSFKILNPNLKDTFLWHLHPEYEIVYVEADSGPRHVGEHLSRYKGNDLVFIGPNIPHLNFDYGVHSPCHQVVVQMKENFLGEPFFNIPELTAIRLLFKNACYGMAFHGETKMRVATLLKNLQQRDRFEQLLCLLQIFQIMATSGEAELLNKEPSANKAFVKQQKRMDFIYKYVKENYSSKPDINLLASRVNLSSEAFCRYFKKQTGQTFTAFLNQYRISEAKNMLLQDRSVTETCYATGFEQLSYFNRIFKKYTGLNPSEFKKTSVPGTKQTIA